jgi:hypothetical protein
MSIETQARERLSLLTAEEAARTMGIEIERLPIHGTTQHH